LYSVSAAGERLEALSEDAIPEELTSVSEAAMEYSHADRGVYVHVTGADVSWFYDTERKQFWPFDTSTTDSHVLIGPIRLAGPDAFGMIQAIHGEMASGSADVNLRIVPGDTAEESAANGKAAITAHLASEDYGDYVDFSRTWKAGRSTTNRPRVRAMWVCLWLHSEGDWAYENITMQVLPFGAWR
jgi:hypothetical protein